jgi:hypothetical protein
MEAPHPLSQRKYEASDTALPVPTWPLGQHTALFRAPPGPGHFLISSLCSLILFRPISSRHFFPCPHRIPLISGDLLASTRGALKRSVSSFHSHAVLLPPGQAVACLLFPIGSQASPDPDLIPTGRAKVFALAD